MQSNSEWLIHPLNHCYHPSEAESSHLSLLRGDTSSLHLESALASRKRKAHPKQKQVNCSESLVCCLQMLLSMSGLLDTLSTPPGPICRERRRGATHDPRRKSRRPSETETSETARRSSLRVAPETEVAWRPAFRVQVGQVSQVHDSLMLEPVLKLEHAGAWRGLFSAS